MLMQMEKKTHAKHTTATLQSSAAVTEAKVKASAQMYNVKWQKYDRTNARCGMHRAGKLAQKEFCGFESHFDEFYIYNTHKYTQCASASASALASN